MPDQPEEQQLRDVVRAIPELYAVIAQRLREGLDATLVKTCSHQGELHWEVFDDLPTRLAYIKAICDIGEVCATKFAESDGTELRVVHIGTNADIATKAADFVLPVK